MSPLGAAAGFYLFVVPVLVANRTMEGGGATALLFGAFLYVQLWLVVAQYAYEALRALYALPVWRPRFLRAMEVAIDRDVGSRGGIGALGGALAGLMSYGLFIYGFGVAYLYTATRDGDAFTEQSMSLLDALYLSAATAMTVGFGDIAPVSPPARALSITQMASSLLYVIFLFSLIGGAIRERTISGGLGPHGKHGDDGRAGV